MNDYGALAEKLMGPGKAANAVDAGPAKHRIDPGDFFESVKAQIATEIEKANGELRRRGLATIERVFMPCYLGKFCVTFGTVLLCSVDFEEVRRRVTLVIVGPPHRKEIARKEYSLSPGLAQTETAPMPGPGAVAADIVSEILETGIGLMQQQSHNSAASAKYASLAGDTALFEELWLSLASLLRSYTAAHGLHAGTLAEIGHTSEKITARHGKKWLSLSRQHALVTWTRENGHMGTVELTAAGNLRDAQNEQALDLAAESWAHDLMKEQQR